MANLSSWPGDTQQDDDGSGQTGTVWNEAWSDAAKASIEDQVHSTTNPTIKPKDTTDEMVTARGSKSSLDARLDVALNEDGTPKPVSGQASETQVASIVGPGSWIQNGDFLMWPDGDAAVPAGWVLDTLTIARAGNGLGDTITKVGPYCAKLTRAAGDGSLKQYLLNTTSFAANGQHLKGTGFVAGCWVKTSVASQARVRLYDGVASSDSGYHAGDGDWHFLPVEHTISGSATELSLYLEVLNSSGDAYFSGASAFPGLVAPADFVHCPMVYGSIVLQKSGTLSEGSAVERFMLGRPTLVQWVQLAVKTVPTGQALIVDVNKYNGAAYASMFSTRPQIDATKARGGAAPDGTYENRCILGANDEAITNCILCFDIDQVGSGTAGADLRVQIRAKQYARPQENLLVHDDGEA